MKKNEYKSSTILIFFFSQFFTWESGGKKRDYPDVPHHLLLEIRNWGIWGKSVRITNFYCGILMFHLKLGKFCAANSCWEFHGNVEGRNVKISREGAGREFGSRTQGGSEFGDEEIWILFRGKGGFGDWDQVWDLIK